MRAIVVHQFGNPDVMRLEDITTLTPSPTQALVRVRAAGVNPVDTYIRSGNYALKPALPYTPGNDAAGVVEAVGAEVKNFKPGDRVYIANDNTGLPRTGIYAEHALCQATQLHHLPAHVSFAQGAAIGVPYGTAVYALFKRASARPGETVFIHGASGGVGIAAVQICRAHGMTVIGTAGTERGLQAVKEQGADVVLNHKEPGYLDEIPKATAGKGVDVILEMNAHINLDKDLTVLARNGRLVLIGNRGRIEIDPRQTMGKESSILGMNLWAGGDVAVAEAHHAIYAGLKSGVLRPIVDKSYPLEQAARAQEDVMTDGALGKIVLTM